jgi:hypothetical protein
VIVQTSESGTSSAIDACIWSPGFTVIEIEIEGAGTSSHEAEYDACAVAETSCSVPVWISDSSPTRATGVDAPAADPDPVARVLRLFLGVLAHRRHGPVATDRVEERVALLERALVVAERVRALVRVGTDVQQLSVRTDAESRSWRSGEPQCLVRSPPPE